VLGKPDHEDYKIVESKFRTDWRGVYDGFGLVILPKKTADPRYAVIDSAKASHKKQALSMRGAARCPPIDLPMAPERFPTVCHRAHRGSCSSSGFNSTFTIQALK
jgi:hypothetical protein